MQRRQVFVLLASTALNPGNIAEATHTSNQGTFPQAHVAWVALVLKRIQAVEAGTTRKALLTVFTTDGGLSTGLARTFVSRDCPYFKVDVEFRVVGRPDQDESGRATMIEDNEDIVLRISRPYLQASIYD